jgi:FMN phosphatase YigB (HAD superfamily)/predicted ATP-grasp superfamily ATP-dependent carboligase
MQRIVVTCGGGFQGLTVLKTLKNVKDTVTYLFDSQLDSVSRYFSDFFTQSTLVKNTETYKKQLYNYCKAHKIDYVIPATSYDLTLLSELKQTFLNELSCHILVPNKESVEIFSNKVKSYEFLKENKIPTQSLLDFEGENTFPLLSKENNGWGGKGIKIIKSQLDLADFNKEDSHLVNYFKEFEEFSIDFFIDEKGELKNLILRKRIITSGGFATITETQIEFYDKYKDYLELVKLAFQKVTLSGFYNLQFIDVNGDCYFTDLNPRIGTSAVLSNYKNGSLFLKPQEKNSFNGIRGLKIVRSLEEKYIPYVDFRKIKAIVFDLDDTLISNKKFILDRCILTYHKLVWLKVSLKEFKVFILSLLNEGKAPYLIDYICQEYNIEDRKIEILNTYKASFPTKTSFFKDVKITLEQLKKRGLKFYILTDNPVVTQRNKVSSIVDIDIFEKVYYTNSLNTQKPDKKCFDLILEENCLESNEVMMVGDNEYRDVIGALKASYSYAFLIKRNEGMTSYSYSDFGVFDEYENAFQITSLKDLLSYYNYYDSIQ